MLQIDKKLNKNFLKYTASNINSGEKYLAKTSIKNLMLHVIIYSYAKHETPGTQGLQS